MARTRITPAQLSIPFKLIGSTNNFNDLVMQSGFDFISTGAGGAASYSKTITLPTAMTQLHAIIATLNGELNSDPTQITDLTAAMVGDIVLTIGQPTNSQFQALVRVTNGANFAASQRWGFSWIAIGRK